MGEHQERGQGAAGLLTCGWLEPCGRPTTAPLLPLAQARQTTRRATC